MKHLLGPFLATFLTACSVVFGWHAFETHSDGHVTQPALGAAPSLVPTTALSTGWRTPQPIPITPGAPVAYRVDDPSFDALPGARALYGTYDGGAYQIEVPDNWNGEVVYYAHGFRGNPPDLTVNAPPLRQHFIDRGFAWAASSYARNGYEPGDGARATYALRSVFEDRVGVPKRRYIYGESMGGNVVTYSLEHYPTAYDGGFSECGVVAGPEELDYFVSWAALAQYFSGVQFISGGMAADQVQALLASNVIPALGEPDALSMAGQEFVDAIMRLTGGERPFFHEGLAKQFDANFTILGHALELGGRSSAAGQNNDTTYALAAGLPITGDALNRSIERFVPAPIFADAAAYPEFQPVTGRIERPLLTIHGTGDMFVPISLEQSYERKVRAAGRQYLLVQRAVRRAGHCNFSIDELRRGFDDLVSWVERGIHPDGEDLSGDLGRAGLRFTKPLEADDPALSRASTPAG